MPVMRSARIDGCVFVGWTVLIIAGQWLLPFESRALQWVATLWMWAGIWIVRRPACLPFLLMTLPVFLCEIHRSWAWAQVGMAWWFLLRLVLEDRPTRREWIALLIIGAAVGFLSWPLDQADRFTDLARFTAAQKWHQWFHPQATWALFPFRQTADRVLIAWLCILLLGRAEYFSTRRLAGAFVYAAVMTLLANYASTLIPWHEAHRFLGTSNFGAFKGRLMHGAGYNQHYLSVIVTLGLPWFFLPLARKYRARTIGWIGLLPPLLLLQQLAFRAAVVAMLLLAVAMWSPVLFSRVKRKQIARHYRLRAGDGRRMALILLASLAVTMGWALRLGVASELSLLKLQLQYTYTRMSPEERYEKGRQLLESDRVSEQRKKRIASKMKKQARKMEAAQQAERARPEESALGDESGADVESGGISDRLEEVDAFRMHMWRLAWTHSREHHLWRGAGAGTWAPFHRSHPRAYRIYYAHTHNTYIDLLFEYGIIPTALAGLAVLIGLIRLACGRVRAGRIWLFYFAGAGVLAMGQHLFYAFTTQIALIPGIVLILRALRPAPR